MATTMDEARRRGPSTKTSGSEESSSVPADLHHPPSAPFQYRNAREYAQVLRPWLWQYYTLTTMQQFLTFCPPVCFQPNSFPGSPSGTSGQSRQQPATRPAPNRAPQGQTQVNGHVPASHRFPGVECRTPTFWKRVSAELIDFTILFYIKLVITVVFMRELGFMDDILDYDILDNLEDIDYDRAFAITSEVIAMEIVNRLLITFFETLCLRRGIGVVGGATPGKRLMGLRVVTCTDLQDLGNNRVLVAPASNIGWFSAFVRSAIKNFTIAFFFPACLTIFLFKHNRAAYDVLANTIVVETEEL
ncbi:protein FAM8A1-like [Babylonia areolata]|uniref:protein FAM8A1-like n=1 Tax=Babylonia areolata TaxID=304850 RepID=UPI003FD198E8